MNGNMILLLPMILPLIAGLITGFLKEEKQCNLWVKHYLKIQHCVSLDYAPCFSRLLRQYASFKLPYEF